MSRWDEGNDYELFMGRWSRPLAASFVRGLEIPRGGSYLDVGCGTGALLDALQEWLEPSELVGVDSSPEFAEIARSRLGERVEVRVAEGEELPFDDDHFDSVMSGLVLNFLPDPLQGLLEWKRVTRAGGHVRAYVWDYAGGMEPLRHFWDAAVALDPAARDLDEGVRFVICRPERLASLFEEAGLSEVASGSVDITAVCSDFADYWGPFLLGQGPAPGYVATLSDEDRTGLEDELKTRVPRSPDGTIRMRARAWTIAGRVS